jgi:GTPase-associated protein 1
MAVLQHFYTSFVDPSTGYSGFQTKAFSPGLTSAQELVLLGHLAYRIPSGLDLRAISTHPVALRYFPLHAREAVFLSTRSCGADERGRPGNFFSHALLLDPHLLRHIPPAFYWGSPFWCPSDPRPAPQEKTLPSLAALEAAPGLSLADIWSFLEPAPRREQLHQLLCALIASSQTHRAILIADTPEHIARWIAAASLLLPPAYRTLLSFATYHHDLRQSPYLITGVPITTSLYASDYETWFLLHAGENRVSQAPPSAYARLASSLACPDLYQSTFLPWFALLPLDPTPAPELGRELDQLATSSGLLP